MLPDRNHVAMMWQAHVLSDEMSTSDQDRLLAKCQLILRPDIEDRNFHSETFLNTDAETYFQSHCQHSTRRVIFHSLKPNNQQENQKERQPDDSGRHVELSVSHGRFHAQPESCRAIPHPLEAERGLSAQGDAWSPGWFQCSLEHPVRLDISAESSAAPDHHISTLTPSAWPQSARSQSERSPHWSDKVQAACDQYVVRRDDGHSVIAGYPWFLDWGRDTLIAARGLLAAGHQSVVEGIIIIFGRFEEHGTLPNCIHGADASNRDTSDAPLWYAVVVDDYRHRYGDAILAQQVDDRRTVRDVLIAIAQGYRAGTPNGIHVDDASGLVWSPSHFTWMDTNFPAGTPRVGYPLEIQALWWRLLSLLAEIDPSHGDNWSGSNWSGSNWYELAKQTQSSVEELFWLPEEGWYRDLINADSGTPACDGIGDHALRCNASLAIGLGLLSGERAQSTVLAMQRYLLVPGAIRSLAPLPARPPLPVLSNDGTLLNDPQQPYWGRYEGDEDTRRKPAYHNGTAWGWPFPSWCEALVHVFPNDPVARYHAQAILSSAAQDLSEGCRGLGHDYRKSKTVIRRINIAAATLKHGPATEVYRVWKILTDD